MTTRTTSSLLCWLMLVSVFCLPVHASLSFAKTADTGSSIYFCKCICFSNYTILPLYRPDDPAKPCLSCTKQFCLDQQLAICKDASKGDTNLDTATGEEGDIQTKCFQRDSALSYATVIIFILVTSGLLCGAALKDRIGDNVYRYKLENWLQRLRPSRGSFAALGTRR